MMHRLRLGQMLGQHMCCLAQLEGIRVWRAREDFPELDGLNIVAIVFCDAQESAIFVKKCEISVRKQLVCMETKFSFDDAPIQIKQCNRLLVRFYNIGNNNSLIEESRISLKQLARPAEKAQQSSEQYECLVLGDWLVESTAQPLGVKLLRSKAQLTSMTLEILRSILNYSGCLSESYAVKADAQNELNTLITKLKSEQQLQIAAKQRRVNTLKTSRTITQAKVARTLAQTEHVKQRQGDAALKLQKHITTLKEQLQKAEPELQNHKAEFEEISQKLKRERRRAVLKLMTIFPIETASDSFYFTISGTLLPSAFEIDHFDPLQVGAALGFVAQLVLLLSKLTDTIIPYEVHPFGSRSYISDLISTSLTGSRVFPLWTGGVLLYRVEYALYLLHRDIERLMIAQELPIVDIKHTLANLKSLMLVLSQPDAQTRP